MSKFSKQYTPAFKVPTVATVFDDLSTSYWLRHAITTAFTRDPVDALNDAEVLVEILRNWNKGIYPSPE